MTSGRADATGGDLHAAERHAPASDEELDEVLSRPPEGVLQSLQRRGGDIVVLGAAGKMGFTLCQMLRRAFDQLGRGDRLLAVSRFSESQSEQRFRDARIATLKCDLADMKQVGGLPEAPNVILMAGQKFGTAAVPARTWGANVALPTLVVNRFPESRIVAFSTGNVYPLMPATSGGALEPDQLAPVGEYAQACMGRERVLEYYSLERGTPLAIMRLNYAVDLRYGVLTDIAIRVYRGEPVDVRMGYVNIIWQGDACAQAIRLLEHAASPPFVLNVTGAETLSVRTLATRLGDHFRRTPILMGREAPDALLSNAGLAERLFGQPSVPLEELIAWTAAWVRRGGTYLGKPTQFEMRDGNY